MGVSPPSKVQHNTSRKCQIRSVCADVHSSLLKSAFWAKITYKQKSINISQISSLEMFVCRLCRELTPFCTDHHSQTSADLRSAL